MVLSADPRGRGQSMLIVVLAFTALLGVKRQR